MTRSGGLVVGETLVQGIMEIEKELEVEITRVGPKGFGSVDQGPLALARHRPCTHVVSC